MGALLVYGKVEQKIMINIDVTNQDTFYNLNYWLDNLRDNADEHILVLLVPNKCDLLLKNQEKREIKREMAFE